MSNTAESYECLLLERDGGVLAVTLNRPQALNAVTPQMHAELMRMWGEAACDESVRVVLLKGAGRAFCAGADQKGPPRSVAERVQSLERQRKLVAAMVDLDKPIVSAVRGAAIGSGLALALMADIVVVANDAKLSDANVRLGVASGDHAVWIWPILCGMAKAKHLLLTGKMFSGEEAERIGLASMAMPADEVDDAAAGIAHELAQGHQDAIMWTKRALNGWLRANQPIHDSSVAFAMLGMHEITNRTEGENSKEPK